MIQYVIKRYMIKIRRYLNFTYYFCIINKFTTVIYLLRYLLVTVIIKNVEPIVAVIPQKI